MLSMEEKLEKRRRETFRISQYAQPHLAEGTQVAQEPSAASSTEVTPDTARIIMHCDVDAFYSQCEENRDPSLATRPLGECTVILRDCASLAALCGFVCSVARFWRACNSTRTASRPESACCRAADIPAQPQQLLHCLT